ncbi:MAG TPA: polysaccharide deacetylase family protein [Blastocatellia bacterium]|nr:polysaccharide deacetylase family protein [Blastocatellia bacterium]
MKGAILNLLRITGAFAPFRWAHRRQALIVTYHRFSEGEGGARISARAFAEQVEYLAAHYTLVPLSRLAGCLRKQELPPRLAAITIDDGYRDAYEIAFPILRKHCAPATVFVVTEFVEGTTWLWTDKARYLAAGAAAQAFEIGIGGRDLRLELNGAASRAVAAGLINAALKPLSEEARDSLVERLAFELGVKMPERPPAEYGAVNWRQAREMADAGVEIGSHTLTHPILTGLGGARLREEVAQSRDRIQNAIGRKVETFCYPNGDYDLRTQLEVARAGYQLAVTTDVGLNNMRNDPLALRRIHGEYDLARFVKNTSGFERAQ